MRAPAVRQGNRGIALVIVLWLITLLSLLSIGQTATVRTETLVTGNHVEAARARAAAYGCIQLGLLELMRPAAARAWQADGEINTAMLDDATLYIRISDESGKVDINLASGPRLDALLRAAEVADGARQDLVDAILDWRDPDSLRRASGAEEAEYRAAGLGHGPRNGVFQSIEELSLVLGMSPALYHILADSITVHSGSADLNPDLAVGALLQRMLHEGMDGAEASAESTTATPRAVARGSGGGRVFSLRCAVERPSGVRGQVEAVIRLTPARSAVPLHEVLVWREGLAREYADGAACDGEVGC